MTPDELQHRIKVITHDKAGDDEAQHSLEDDLHQDLIEIFCPKWIKDEISKLNQAEFARWCA